MRSADKSTSPSLFSACVFPTRFRKDVVAPELLRPPMKGAVTRRRQVSKSPRKRVFLFADIIGRHPHMFLAGIHFFHRQLGSRLRWNDGLPPWALVSCNCTEWRRKRNRHASICGSIHFHLLADPPGWFLRSGPQRSGKRAASKNGGQGDAGHKALKGASRRKGDTRRDLSPSQRGRH